MLLEIGLVGGNEFLNCIYRLHIPSKSGLKQRGVIGPNMGCKLIRAGPGLEIEADVARELWAPTIGPLELRSTLLFWCTEKAHTPKRGEKKEDCLQWESNSRLLTYRSMTVPSRQGPFFPEVHFSIAPCTYATRVHFDSSGGEAWDIWHSHVLNVDPDNGGSGVGTVSVWFSGKLNIRRAIWKWKKWGRGSELASKFAAAFCPAMTACGLTLSISLFSRWGLPQVYLSVPCPLKFKQ